MCIKTRVVLYVVNQHAGFTVYGVGLNVCKPLSSQRMFCFANRACKVWNLLPTNTVLLRFSWSKKCIYNFTLNKNYLRH